MPGVWVPPRLLAGTYSATSCQLAGKLQQFKCLMWKSVEQYTILRKQRLGGVPAARLIQALAEEGIVRDDADGVVRISLLHYNMPREVAYLINVLNGVPYI